MAFLDETGLAELWTLVKAEDAERAEIEVKSYTGTGTYGSANPNSLTFNFVPKIVFIMSRLDYDSNNGNQGSVFGVVIPSVGFGGAQTGGNYACWYGWSVTLSGKTISWYQDYSDNAARYQMNISSGEYTAVAIG